MPKLRAITFLLTAALIAASFAGCAGSSAETADDSTQQEQSQDQSVPQKERRSMAKVVSLDGDQLTVISADRPDGTSGATPSAVEGTQPEEAAPDGSQRPAGGPGQPGQGGGEITFTGEQTTYTLSPDVVIMNGTGENAAEIDLSELAAYDVIRFTTIEEDDGTVLINSIVVME